MIKRSILPQCLVLERSDRDQKINKKLEIKIKYQAQYKIKIKYNKYKSSI